MTPVVVGTVVVSAERPGLKGSGRGGLVVRPVRGAAASNSKPGLTGAPAPDGGGPGCGPLVVGVYLNRRGWSPASRPAGRPGGRVGAGPFGAAGRRGAPAVEFVAGDGPSRDPGRERPGRGPGEPGGPGSGGPGGGAAGRRRGAAGAGGPQAARTPGAAGPSVASRIPCHLLPCRCAERQLVRSRRVGPSRPAAIPADGTGRHPAMTGLPHASGPVRRSPGAQPRCTRRGSFRPVLVTRG